MKKIFKLVAVLAALTVAGFGFVACSDDDDDGETVIYDLRKPISGDVVATYAGSQTEKVGIGEVVVTLTITFYTAGNQTVFQGDQKVVAGNQAAYFTFCEGTYDGDPTTNGTVALTVTKDYEPNEAGTELIAETESYSVIATILGTKATLTYGNSGAEIGEFTRQ